MAITHIMFRRRRGAVLAGLAIVVVTYASLRTDRFPFFMSIFDSPSNITSMKDAVSNGSVGGRNSQRVEHTGQLWGARQVESVKCLFYIYSGGPKFDKKFEAQFETFADKSTWWVTRERLPTKNRIVLSAEAESGGRKMLYRKTMRLLDDLIRNKNATDHYDFIMKADDDTYVNIPRIKQLLAHIDPDVPFFAGSTRFGLHTGKNAFVSLGEMVQSGKYFAELQHVSMCHGGSGYVLSRGLLRLLRQRLQRCELQPPHTHMEDAKLAFCIYQYTGLTCSPLHDQVPGFDFFHNAKATSITRHVIDQAQFRDPVSFLSASTFHKVSPASMRDIHTVLQRVGHDHDAVTQVALNTGSWFANHHKRFVMTWNCTTETARGTFNSICQDSALYRAETPRRDVTTRGTYSVLASRSPFSVDRGDQVLERVVDVAINQTLAILLVSRSGHFDAAAKIRGVLDQLDAVATHSPHVIVITSDMEPQPWHDVLVRTSGVVAVLAPASVLPGAYTDDQWPLFVTLASVLQDVADDYTVIMHWWIQSAHARLILTSDPFACVTSGTELSKSAVVFIPEVPSPWLTRAHQSPVVVRDVFGVCDATEAHTPPRRIGPGVVTAAFAMGHALSHAHMFGALAAYARTGAPPCTVHQALSRLVWNGTVAARTRTVVFIPEHSPLAVHNRSCFTFSG
eukprot:m.457301 g.457301  ORF g.457301 m.457301 type:complete len:680 (+) comp21577_c0_seq4:196-2235(+)